MLNFVTGIPLLHQLKSIHRGVIALLFSIIVYFFSPFRSHFLVEVVFCWLSFCIVYISISWYTFFTMPIELIMRRSKEEDGNRAFVSLFIFFASFACLIAVFIIIISSKTKPFDELTTIGVCVLGMICSWILIHTIYVFHYARLYYEEENGLDFPGDSRPNYIDFAYFSFVLGCTFQVSDVSVSSRRIRQVVLFHGLLSFGLNTFVVALSINIVSGLIN